MKIINKKSQQSKNYFVTASTIFNVVIIAVLFMCISSETKAQDTTFKFGPNNFHVNCKKGYIYYWQPFDTGYKYLGGTIHQLTDTFIHGQTTAI